MINGLKQLKNLSIPQKLIRSMIIKLFQAKIKLGQGSRAAKTQAIENLHKGVSEGDKQEPSGHELLPYYYIRNELSLEEMCISRGFVLPTCSNVS